MPRSIEDFSLWRAVDAFERQLKTIRQADGYNTTPIVQIGAKMLSQIPDGEFPFLAIEMGDLTVDQEELGGYSQGLIRYSWPAYVWGYVKSSGHRRDLYKAGQALLADVLAAVYANETLPDGNGQDTVHFCHPGEIVFDMESFGTENRGYFNARFDLVVDIIRGGTP